MSFSRFRKYLLFFSPSLYHLTLLLIIDPFVLYCTNCSNSFFLVFSSSVNLSFSRFDNSFCSIDFSNQKILASKSASLLFILCFFCFAYFSEYSLIFILIISQSSESFTVLSFLYSFATVFIITGIWLIYSISLRNDVLSFQYPGPLGFVLRVKAILMIE